MKKNIALVFALLLGGQVFSQDEPYARRLMNETLAAIETMTDFRAEITTEGENGAVSQKGVLYVKGEKSRLELGAVTAISDGEYTYVVQPEEKEVMVNRLSEEEKKAGNILLSMLRGVLTSYEPRTDKREGDIQYLRLVPTDQGSPLQYILIGIDMKTKLPVFEEEVLVSGGRSSVKIGNVERGKGSDEVLYRFDQEKYKKEGYYIAKP